MQEMRDERTEQTKRMPQIHEEIQALHKGCDWLEKVIAELETRLSAVLRPSNSEQAAMKPDGPERVRVPMAQEIHLHAARTGTFANQLSSLIDRLEI